MGEKRLFGTRNLDFHYPRLIAIWHTDLYKNTMLLISFNFGLSGLHVSKYPPETTMFLSDKTHEKEKKIFLKKVPNQNILR